MKHLMVDIETMSSRKDAAVIAIGARLFDKDGTGKGFEAFINTNQASAIGTVSDETMKWWSKQNQDVRAQVFGGVLSPAEAAYRFNEFVKEHQPATVWAKPPQFDIVILQHMFKQVNIDWPFHYRDERCSRTLLAIMRQHDVVLKPDAELRAHNPLDDATRQAREVVAFLQRVSFSKPELPVVRGSAPSRQPQAPASSAT